MNSLFEWLSRLFQGVKAWVVVQPWEKCVRVRLGKQSILFGPGVHLRIPWIDEVYIVNTRLRISSVPAQTITTSDGKTVTVSGIVGFRISEPLVAMLSLQQPESSCAALTLTALSEAIIGSKLELLSPTSIESFALKRLEQMMYGVTFDFVRVVDFAVVRTYRILNEQWRPQTGNDIPMNSTSKFY